MRGRQTISRQWLILAGSSAAVGLAAARRLPRRSGVLLLEPPGPKQSRQLRLLARRRDLLLVTAGDRTAVRAHDARELRSAMLRRAPLILLSPIYPTRTHPGWKPIPRMRAAALARLARRRAIALGGMNEARFARIAALGFVAWAGISAWSER